jgi:hypothetical protein
MSFSNRLLSLQLITDKPSNLFEDCVNSVYNNIVEAIHFNIKENNESKEYYDKHKVYVCPLYYRYSTYSVRERVIEKFKGLRVKFSYERNTQLVIIKP